MKEAILRNEGLIQRYPQKWYSIKQKLEDNISIGKKFINYNIYRQWCTELFDYKNEADQRALLITLDKIGSIVFFNRPILNNLQVLNPDWITTGAYAILTSKLTKENKGHLKPADLNEIFIEEKEIFSNEHIKIKYTEDQYQFIIQLMLEYNLCQENPLAEQEYLIPSAFGAKPSNDYLSHKKDSRAYRIQFDSPFEMLIIHRFIAKNLSKAQGKDYWQSGVFIKDTQSNTFALVETNLHSFRIDLWIKGENIRGFWESIRRDFYDIFSIYKKFDFKQEVLYSQDGKEVFLPYQEMLDCLRNGVKILQYYPAYNLKNVDVLKVLDLFEDSSIIEKNILEENYTEKKEINIEINPVISVNPTFNNSLSSLEINEQEDEQKEQRIAIYKNKKFKNWKRNAMILFIISLIFTLIVWNIYLNEPNYIGPREFWTSLKNGEIVKWAGIAISFIWNAFIGKMVYERFFDPSKEKAFKDLIIIPKGL
jgi:hypothetical protein